VRGWEGGNEGCVGGQEVMSGEGELGWEGELVRVGALEGLRF
jgi:hypothetical protein